jgi:hypothetical protein
METFRQIVGEWPSTANVETGGPVMGYERHCVWPTIGRHTQKDQEVEHVHAWADHVGAVIVSLRFQIFRMRSVVKPERQRMFCSGGKILARKILDLKQLYGLVLQFVLAVGISLGLSSVGDAHTGLVDGYGCHRGSDKISYHCHQGQFVGRTFKSKEDFLRELRGGKSGQLSPKSNPPPIEKKPDE